MGQTLIKNARLIQPGVGCKPSNLLIDEGVVKSIDIAGDHSHGVENTIDAEGMLVTPGLVDIHCHGIQNFLYEADGNQISEASGVLPRYGTTCVLPTLYTVMNHDCLDKLSLLSAQLLASRGARTPGFHLEGPFLKLKGAGADTIAGDIGLLEEVLAACDGRVRAMSISPDTENVIPVIERLRENNIAVFMTHTQASVAQTSAAIAAGARHATHFYDVFPMPPEEMAGVRPVGAVETILASHECSVDFICDNVHVHPMAIKAAIAAKGWQNVIAITDANIGAGFSEGVFKTPWGFSVQVRPNDAARIADTSHPHFGQLAGSSLTMDKAMANLMQWLDLPIDQIWAMGTLNPARVVGLHSMGSLAVGSDADFVIWRKQDNNLLAHQTWIGGKCIYRFEQPLI